MKRTFITAFVAILAMAVTPAFAQEESQWIELDLEFEPWPED